MSCGKVHKAPAGSHVKRQKREGKVIAMFLLPLGQCSPKQISLVLNAGLYRRAGRQAESTHIKRNGLNF